MLPPDVLRALRRAAVAALAGCYLLIGPAWIASAHAEPPPQLPSDPTLAALIQQSLAARPELASAMAAVRASEERVGQSRALPDPMLQLGVQNDGFKSIEVGRTETSYVSLMASQTFPWPGKLRLQGNVAARDAEVARSAIVRVRLSTEAEVRRAYLELVLARQRATLLDEVEAIWRKALGVARAMYETGGASQTDLLRAQLELQRIKQRRVALETEAKLRVQALNRLRNHPLDEPIATPTRVDEQPALEPLRAVFSERAALARSPELAAARVAVLRSGESTALAERRRYPDFTVGTGIMYRGQMPPMWQVTLAAPVPLFSAGKQRHAAAESRALTQAAKNDVAALRQLIVLRTSERRAAFNAALETLAIYRQGLLVASRATAESTLAQYTTGKLSFAAVLEANAGYLADQEGYLQAVADAERILIAEAEVSLEPSVSLASAGGSGNMAAVSSAMPRPAGMSAAAAASASGAGM